MNGGDVVATRVAVLVDEIDDVLVDVETAELPPTLAAHVRAALNGARRSLTLVLDDLPT